MKGGDVAGPPPAPTPALLRGGSLSLESRDALLSSTALTLFSRKGFIVSKFLKGRL